ncbi:MAG TPA: alpha/beta fold hydrolase [Vicinamibacterales bacterium]|nr:alpha/beta fold hydrolase [Vicinamibacterales bacterium]
MTRALTSVACAVALSGALTSAVQQPVEEEVTFANGAVTLGGTLAMPAGAGPFPAVVLITGSGPQNRDEEVFGFKVFKTLSDALVAQGIAVLRYDDRGVGKSTGNLVQSVTDDFAADALAGVALLKTRSSLAGDRIGLLGHSEGAGAAAVAATKSKDVAFVVMLAGTGVRGDVVLRQQAADGARANGATPERVERIVAAHRKVTDAAAAGVPAAELGAAVRELATAQIEALPPAAQATIPDRDAYLNRAVPTVVAQMSSPWMKHLLSFDPATAIAKVTCPVLAIFGAKDTQVPPSLNRAPVEAALKSNAHAKVVELPEANHLFQRAKTGLVTEYASLEKAFVDGLTAEIGTWIKSLPKK